MTASANLESINDDGFLGSPYRLARVFGTYVHENDPRYPRTEHHVFLWRTPLKACP